MSEKDLNALIERLEDLIAQAEADMTADSADAEETGERVDLHEYEIELPVEVAKVLAQALRDRQPVLDEIARLRWALSKVLDFADQSNVNEYARCPECSDIERFARQALEGRSDA